MILCESCGAVCSDAQESCQVCGVALRPKDHDAEDAQQLAKDNWSVEESESGDAGAGAEPQAKAPTQDDAAPLGSLAMKRPFEGAETKPEEPARAVGQPGARKSGSFGRTLQMVAVKPAEEPPAEARGKIARGKETLPLGFPGHTEGAKPIVIESESAPEKQAGRIEESPRKIQVPAGRSRIGSLSREDDERFARRSEKSTPPEIAVRTRLGVPQDPGLAIALGISSAILIATWLIPDTLLERPIFPFNTIGSTHGAELIALLAEPVCGALLLGLLLAPMGPAAQAVGSLIVGLGAILLPLLLRTPSLPIDRNTILIAAGVALAFAIPIFSFLEIAAMAHIALLLVPGALFATAAIGLINGDLPAAHLVVFKDPLKLYAAMLATGVSASALVSFGLARRARR